MTDSERSALISRLTDGVEGELAAAAIYMRHSAVCASWGLQKLAERNAAEMREEVSHALRVLQQIVNLGGRGTVGPQIEIPCGCRAEAAKDGGGETRETVLDHFRCAAHIERRLVESYGATIEYCHKIREYGCAAVLTELVTEGEGQIEWINAQVEAVRRVGLQNYAAAQMGGAEPAPAGG